MHNKNNSLCKLGGLFSILVGVVYILIGITYLLLPNELQSAEPSQFFSSIARNSKPIILLFLEFALSAVFALAAVTAISEAVRSDNEGWVDWTRNLAYVGFVVTAINSFNSIMHVPERAAAYMAGDASTQAAITAICTELDPAGWLRFGGVGLWLLIVSILALRTHRLPKVLAYVGIVFAIFNWLAVVGYVIHMRVLVALSAGLGGIILAPIWYIWIGLKLRRQDLLSVK